MIFKLFRKKKYRIIALIILGGILLFVFRAQWLIWIGDFLIIQDNLHPADVIHVIAGEDYRTDYALSLYKKGYAKMVFFTGGWCKTHGYYHGKHGKALSEEQGIPEDAIAYDDSNVISTFMEVVNLNGWIKRAPRPIHSVIVVSDPFHMRRARWAYKRVLDDSIEVQMAPVPFERTSFQRRWWKDWESRKFVREEYEKYLYYILRYQISRGKFRDWLASMDRE